MKGSYDLKGNVYFQRDNGEQLKFNYAECIEIFATVADVSTMPFDRDLICEQMEEVLGVGA